jgi:hypothetical protein
VSLKVLDLESKVNLENSEIFRKLASVKNFPKSEKLASVEDLQKRNYRIKKKKFCNYEGFLSGLIVSMAFH